MKNKSRPRESESKRRWAGGTSKVFLEFGGFFVPDRDLQAETIRSLIPEVSPAGVIVELCCGEGLLAQAILERHAHGRYLALDGSPTMLKRAKKRLEPFAGRVEFREFDLADTSWRRFEAPLHAVVSSLAIHHLDGRQKRALYRDMTRALAPRGVLVIADLIQPCGDLGVKVAGRQWDDAVRERSQRERGDLSGFEEFQRLDWNYFTDSHPSAIDKPSPLLDQLKGLEAAGLTGVDVYWMKAGHAIFGGQKPVQGKSQRHQTRSRR